MHTDHPEHPPEDENTPVFSQAEALKPLAVRPLGLQFHSPHLDVDAAELVWPARGKAEEAAGTVRHVHYRVVRRDAVAVLAHVPERDAFVLVEQCRYPAAAKGEEVLLEIPAGVIENGERPETTAQRELREEAGVTLRTLRSITTAFASPGYSDERLILYYGTVDRFVDAGGGVDIGERTRRRLVSRARARKMWAEGRIRDLKTFAALAWFFAHADPASAAQALQASPEAAGRQR